MMNTEEDSLVIPTPSKEDIKPKFSYMENIIQISKVLHMWPDTKVPKLHHLLVFLVTSSNLSLIVSFAIRIVQNVRNFDAISVLVEFGTVFISGTFRYAYVYVRGNKYLLLISQMQKNFIHYSLFPKENRKSLLKYYTSANRIRLAYTSFVSFWVLQMCTIPLVGYIWKMSRLPSDLNETSVQPPEYPVIFKTYAPFDYSEQPGNAIFYIHQFTSLMLMCWIYVTTDCFWGVMFYLTIGQFALLKDSVETISEILSRDLSADATEARRLRENEIQSLEEGLKHCIRHHQFLREFVCLLEDLYNPIVLANTLHCFVSVGFMLLDVIIAMNIGDLNRALFSLEYFITSIFHLFFFDWLGTELRAKEMEVANAVHTISWYRCPTQKALLIMMSLQARRPHRLTAGKIFSMSLDFFINTLKAFFSSFTFLLKMRK